MHCRIVSLSWCIVELPHLIGVLESRLGFHAVYWRAIDALWGCTLVAHRCIEVSSSYWRTINALGLHACWFEILRCEVASYLVYWCIEVLSLDASGFMQLMLWHWCIGGCKLVAFRNTSCQAAVGVSHSCRFYRCTGGCTLVVPGYFNVRLHFRWQTGAL